MEGYVYLLTSTDINGEISYKIGITKNDIKKRIKQLQTGNPNEITLHSFYKTKHYKLLEKWLHRKFNTKKTEMHNEWFFLNIEDVNNFNTICEDYNNTIDYLKKENPFF